MKLKTTIFIILAAASLTVNAQNKLFSTTCYDNKPLIQMTINNKPAWVLLDTGSDISVVNIDDKKEFGFSTKIKEGYLVPGFGSDNNQLHRALNIDLKYENTLLWNPIYAFDISNIADSIEKRTGKRITAIIGTNLMSMYNFVIDMGNNQVTVNGVTPLPQIMDGSQAKITMNNSNSIVQK